MPPDIERLKESNNFLNLLLENITSAVFIVDSKIRIRKFNDSFKVLFHKKEDQILGELCGNAINCVFSVEEHKDCGMTTHCGKCILRKSLVKTFVKKVPTFRKKLVRDFYIKEKKIIKFFQFTTKYVTYNGEEMSVIILDDITELETKNIELKHEINEKNELLGILAHDIRNPIQILTLYADYFLEDKSLPDDLHSFFETLMDNCSYISTLLNNTLDYTKLDSSALHISRETCDYSDIMAHIITNQSIIAAKKNIKLDFKTTLPRDFTISVDVNKIRQVIINLISNGIKYSYPDTTITVTVNLCEDCLETSVIDQGQGIPENDLPYVFFQYYKASAKPTGNEKSTGLGLAITKKIIEGHKGEIMVESKEGEGSVFTFLLPLDGKS